MEKLSKKFYHYTSLETYKKIVSDENGHLRPRKMLFHSHELERPNEVSKLCYKSTTFAVLDESHPEWINTKFSNETSLMSTVIFSINQGIPHDFDEKIIKLEIDASNLKNVYVADWGCYLPENNKLEEWQSYYTAQNIYQGISNVRASAGQNYANSMVHIDDYKGNYQIPEVLCFDDIPKKNITPIFASYRARLMNAIKAKDNFETNEKHNEISDALACRNFKHRL